MGEDRRSVSVRINSETYKELREISNEINKEFDLIGKEAATINDVIDAFTVSYRRDEREANLIPIAKLGSIITKKKVRPNQ